MATMAPGPLGTESSFGGDLFQRDRVQKIAHFVAV
jgi:hypothetical protein